MYLIDTDTLVYLLRGKQVVIENFAAHADDKALSAISYGELMYGARKSSRRAENADKVRQLAESFPVIAVSQAIMEVFGGLKSDLERAGERLADFDLVIAATALRLNFRLVTSNLSHFSRIPGLAVENWGV